MYNTYTTKPVYRRADGVNNTKTTVNEIVEKPFL